MNPQHFQIRDPIHGVVYISKPERAVIDSKAFQRLRFIKQVGFADFAFPCATHTRYSHSLGAMFIATKIFDRVTSDHAIAPHERARMRQAVRLAALLHDIGHPPLSHTTEMLMPQKSAIYQNAQTFEKATHEDFTQQFILASSLTTILEDNFKDLGVTPKIIASLLLKKEGEFFCGAVDYTPLLRQIISSEIDADRMDYLLRDSLFCGVNYGKFDSDWLIENLVSVLKNNQLFLGLKARAIFAFEDFLLSRYHMFLSVYLHHTPVIMEKMLERFFKECPDDFVLPVDIERYMEQNDLDLWQTLRCSKNPWAQRIVERKPYIMLYENLAGPTTSKENLLILDELSRHVDVISSRSQGVLSKYFGKYCSSLFVEDAQKNSVPLEEYSLVFNRYQTPAELFRIFIDAKDEMKAQSILRDLKKNKCGLDAS